MAETMQLERRNLSGRRWKRPAAVLRWEWAMTIACVEDRRAALKERARVPSCKVNICGAGRGSDIGRLRHGGEPWGLHAERLEHSGRTRPRHMAGRWRQAHARLRVIARVAGAGKCHGDCLPRRHDLSSAPAGFHAVDGDSLGSTSSAGVPLPPRQRSPVRVRTGVHASARPPSSSLPGRS